MSKSIFLGGQSCCSVYSPAQIAELEKIAGLNAQIVTKDTFYDYDLTDTEYIFSTWGMLQFDEKMFAAMPKLKAVFYAAGATDRFALPFLERGIKVSSAWTANAIPVAEFTTAQIILALKDYFRFMRNMTNPEAGKMPRTCPGVYGETVALIGSGTISTLVKKMLANYNVNVLTVHSLPEKRDISIEEAFARAYVVSNHLFNAENNQKCLKKEHFLSMRENATFINTGRGQQVDEAGFLEAMKERPDLTALLDVTYPEPPEEGSPMYTLPNIHLTPHIAGSLNDEFHRMAEYMIEEYKLFTSTGTLQYEVTKEMLAMCPAAVKN
jgi:phosphoglycerate dehydrogenase-like enzyme